MAAGHAQTANAARIMLDEGGNAFDAVLAAFCTACVAEPVLTSLGGGGFLLSRTAKGGCALYDFFVQTPHARVAPGQIDFYPMEADFGTTRQEFHIGMGAIATPGVVKGLFRVHRELCTMPMARIVEPAVRLARRGLQVNALQAYIFRVIEPIIRASPEAWRTFESTSRPGELVGAGERLRRPRLADTLEALAREGEGLFYRGEIARRIVRDVQERGGHLTEKDLRDYRVIKRNPLEFRYRGARVFMNPPPSTGGALINFAMKLLESVDFHSLGFGSFEYLNLLAEVMAQTNIARRTAGSEALPDRRAARRLLGPGNVQRHIAALQGHLQCARGTTHVSVIDGGGNMAAMSVSNGEGCGYVIPETGIMLNNMLGEEDLVPCGFNRWPENRRIASMMSPTFVFQKDGTAVAAGSGGSNRIRTAVLQVLVNLLDFRMPLRRAVLAPRIHYENGLLNVERGFRKRDTQGLLEAYPLHKLWGERNLFFGGVHAAAVCRKGAHYEGAGDPRRGGRAIVLGG